MIDQFSNNDVAKSDNSQLLGPDAHGQAAMLLSESLIHGLMARSAISGADAVEIVAIAGEIKVEIAPKLGDSPSNMHKSLTLLKAIEESLSIDVASSGGLTKPSI